jgi:hypothetical protein
MVIGNLKYLIGPASGLYPHPLDVVPMGVVSARAATAQRRSVVRGPLYSRGVALIHNLGRKGKSCTCDAWSNHVTCV